VWGYVDLLLLSDGELNDRENTDDWNFDADSAVTMVRPSKSKELTPPLSNHTPNDHTPSPYENQNGGSPALGDSGTGHLVEEEERKEEGNDEAGTPVEEVAPQLGIDDTAFASASSPTQRKSIVSASGEEAGKRGSVVSLESVVSG
jgi:hypothetical protein